MGKVEEIAEWIELNAVHILPNLKQESVDIYTFMTNEFRRGDVNKNYVFQFVFRAYYGFNNARLSAEFKEKYFQLLEENRQTKEFDFKSIIRSLSMYSERNGKEILQFSFITKMANMIDPSKPIYDSKVAKMFSFSRPQGPDPDRKLDKYLAQFHEIENSYNTILREGLLPNTLERFDKTYPNYKLHDIKKLDFIFWTAGKIKYKSSIHSRVKRF